MLWRYATLYELFQHINTYEIYPTTQKIYIFYNIDMRNVAYDVRYVSCDIDARVFSTHQCNRNRFYNIDANELFPIWEISHFVEWRVFYRALLQKRPRILSILLAKATPYTSTSTQHKSILQHRNKWILSHMRNLTYDFSDVSCDKDLRVVSTHQYIRNISHDTKKCIYPIT